MAKESLYFLGDIHADTVWLSFTIGMDRIKDATIIQVGDFGVGFLNDEERAFTNLNNICALNNVMVYAIRGNHDNPSLFDSGNRYSNLKFLKDYTVLKICDLNILLVGGSISIDRLHRKENITYWEDEVFSYDESKLLKVLKSIKKVDIVVTHSAPTGVFPSDLDSLVHEWIAIDKTLLTDIVRDRNEHSKLMNHLIWRDLKPSFWYYGHFHRSRLQIHKDIVFKLLNINELYQHTT